ncbi:MAG: hypothetical protein ACKOW3_07005 [Hyphomicrobium sp.]
MSFHINHFSVNAETSLLLNPFDNLVLLRICSEGGATISSIIKDLKPLLSLKISSTDLKTEIDFSTQRLCELGYIQKSLGSSLPTIIGRQKIANCFGISFSDATKWKEIKNVVFIGKALCLTQNFNETRELLSDPFLFLALILKKEYKLDFPLNISKEDLCQLLAKRSLQSAFSDKYKGLIKKNFRLPAKLARLFASCLSKSGKEFSSYRSLFVALAAESVGARNNSEAAIKSALIINFMNEFLGNFDLHKIKLSHVSRDHSSSKHSKKNTLPDALHKVATEKKRPPSFEDFVRAVRGIVRQSAQGWSGSKKIFISHVWDAFSNECEGWGLSENDFKSMLTEAHRRGDLMLCIADLKSEDLRYEIERSATPDRNAIWHYVRIEG